MRSAVSTSLVNNAGFVRDRMFVSSSLEEWDAVIRVHLRGHFCPASHAVQLLARRAEGRAGPSTRASSTRARAPGCRGAFAQSAYSAAKGGIASLTLVQAAELGRYGITANALAPAARTRMTEQAFADKMKKPAAGFDVQDPENIAPTVVWLGSRDSRGVTGCVFELEGGKIMLCGRLERRADASTRDARWDPREVGPAVDRTAGRAAAAEKGLGDLRPCVQFAFTEEQALIQRHCARILRGARSRLAAARSDRVAAGL